MATQTQSPGTMADDTSVGTIAWSNPDNAKVSDNVYATATKASNGQTHRLVATNFGFSIPAGATINGIIVESEIKYSGGNGVINGNRQLLKAGSLTGTGKSNGDSWPATDTYDSWGSSSDLWGATLSADDVNNSGFGVGLYAYGYGANWIAYVDHIRITVYYTENGSTVNISTTAKSKIAHISIPKLISPEELSATISPSTLVWEIPEDYMERPVSCEVQIATDENFENIECDFVSFRDNFEYWNGSDWTTYPVDGVEYQYYGNQARVTTALTSGNKHWRVRGVIKYSSHEYQAP